MPYPRQLSKGNNNTVIAVSETEVAKLFTGDTRSEIGAEAEKLKFANAINGLVVKFIRLDFDNVLNAELLIMERLYPLDFRSFEVEKRQLWLEVFEYELIQLNNAGFAHRDLKRPSSAGGEWYDNIFLTTFGIRLIDVGISALKIQVGDKIFNHYIELEKKELVEFKKYFLER